MVEPSPYPIAPLWRRLVALLYDFFPLFGISCGVVGITIGLAHLTGSSEFDEAYQNILPSWLVMPLLLGSWLAFYIGFWQYKRQTLGMLAWRIGLKNCSDEPSMDAKQLLIRAVVAVISLGCFGLGYLWMLFDSQRRTWHDIASNTQVVLYPK